MSVLHLVKPHGFFTINGVVNIINRIMKEAVGQENCLNIELTSDGYRLRVRLDMPAMDDTYPSLAFYSFSAASLVFNRRVEYSNGSTIECKISAYEMPLSLGTILAANEKYGKFILREGEELENDDSYEILSQLKKILLQYYTSRR